MKYTDKPIKRIVVKVGTSSLVRNGAGLDACKLDELTRQLVEVRNSGKDVILVTSGAIRAGMERLGIHERPRTIPEQQASAAIGQSALMQKYTESLSSHGVIAAQVLLTSDDFHDRLRYLNARNTLYTLLRFGCLPIVNENDTVATEEIRLGDNDTLSALVAACADADLLLNLSDVDGLLDGDPSVNDSCKLIEEVRQIDDNIEALCGGTHGLCGTGGMRTKIKAAKIATNSGVRMVIANSSRANVIVDAAEGKNVGTRFLARAIELNHRKRWIAFGNRVKGSIIINNGASKMLADRGKSLLAAGIVGCEGGFQVGDLVAVIDENRQKIARGLTNYGASEIALIRGKHSDEIEQILGYKDFDEVIHRDNLVLGV